MWPYQLMMTSIPYIQSCSASLHSQTPKTRFALVNVDGWCFAGQVCEAVIITIDEYSELRTAPVDKFSVKVQVIPPETYSDEEFDGDAAGGDNRALMTRPSRPRKRLSLPPERKWRTLKLRTL